METPLSIQHLPKAIVHVDGDAFFASCEQSRHPALKGKPVIIGKERGIASSMSYEAKARGVTRGMRLTEVKRLCPDGVFLPSDYETYSLLSKRLFAIVRRFTPDVEEYSIDECFADITGLQRPLRMSYQNIVAAIKHDLDTELGVTFSAGLAPTKVLAKLASKWKKPSGLTCIPGWDIHRYLAKLPVEKVWGIGAQSTAFLAKHHVYTALEFARKPESWVTRQFSKPFHAVWKELNGKSVIPLDINEKDTYASIQKFKTFSPASNDRDFVFAQLCKNIEGACMKARRYKLVAHGAMCLVRTQDFRDDGVEVRFTRGTAFAHEVIHALTPAFSQMLRPALLYRSTGVVLLRLKADTGTQLNLFDPPFAVEKMKKLYQAMDALREKYGKYMVVFGASFLAHRFAQHVGERGDAPARRRALFKGETTRKRVGIPMLLGE